jgi:alanine racemase
MNRIGLEPENAVEFIKKVQNCDFLNFKGIFTHLANAEDCEKTKVQLDIWSKIINSVDTEGLLLHALNTAGSMRYCDDIKSNMVRMGIAIYGLEPDLPEGVKFRPDLKQVMGLKGRITNIHTMSAGQGISYGYSFIADKEIKVATIPIGYADGVPRALSNKIYAELNGKKIKQIGNITMDQMMFDITDVEAQEGDVITLLDDKELSIDNWARIIGTINYELTCRLKVRLPRVYVR